MKTTREILNKLKYLEEQCDCIEFPEDSIEEDKVLKAYYNFLNKKWYSEEEIIEKISIKDSDGEKILSLDKAVSFLNELLGDEK